MTHPSLTRTLEVRAKNTELKPSAQLDATWLQQLCLDCGADDVGFVSLERPELDSQRQDILWAFPHAKSIIAFACGMNREPVRSVARSLANNEFHQVGDHVTETSHKIARKLEDMGVRAMNEPVAFPMEADKRTWVQFLAGEKNIVMALLSRKIRLKGALSLLIAFGKCFPSAA